MKGTSIHTTRLQLVLKTKEEVLAMIESMDPGEKSQISSTWLSQVVSSSSADPWVHGFSISLGVAETPIGQIGFKGPPASDGNVEIAYGIDPDYQGNGYATEAVDALTRFAFNWPNVAIIRAHTLPEPNASNRVLKKCGFQFIGMVSDPEDGPVWRWEKRKC